MKTLLLFIGLLPLSLNAQITNLETFLRLENMMINDAVTNLVNIGWEFGGQETTRKKDDNGNVVETITYVSVKYPKHAQELIFITSVDWVKSKVLYSGLELKGNNKEDFFISDVEEDLVRLGFKKKNKDYERYVDENGINFKLIATHKENSKSKSLKLIRKKI
ncbi:MAG: hypothetical protein GX159_11235 [Flavobacteriaceae bacterium]|jgi:hypothetical protein|nr:hypothetical protein [Flavobacteriaceae bacterium]